VRSHLVPGALIICLMSGAVFAAPDEIQVYTEELNNPGRFGLEQHLNYTVKGQQTPEYAGQMTSQHVLQVTPEFSYGLTKTLEAGLYMPFAFTPDGNSYLNGLRVRLKYIAPRQDEERVFYGMNVEVGRVSYRTSDSISGMEVRPIIGYRDVRWLLSFNPILNMGLAGNISHQPQFEPALKATHSLIEGVRGGLEYYGSYGPLNHMLPGDQRGHSVYAVTDVEKNGFDVNFGIGRGFVNEGDKWVMKAIVALPLE
jgi:hypothetical protein